MIKASFTTKSLIEIIEKTEKEIKKHNILYYKENAPIISDYEYDMLCKDLEQLEILLFGKVREDSILNKIGNDLKD